MQDKPQAIHSLKLVFAIVGVAILLALYSSFYTVQEGQNALILRLGEIVSDAQDKPYVMQPGLHVRWPLIDRVRRFDVRLKTFDVQSSRILTEEQKYVLVDYYVKWRIADLPLYYKRTGGNRLKAHRLLQQKINDTLRAAFGKRSITEVISGHRGDIMSLLRERADVSAQSLGISVIDVRIKRIDLPKEVSNSVFKRMSTEREQVATKHRSDGRAQAAIVRANADAQVTVILAKATAEAAKIKAEGIGKAASIYSETYSKAPDFYRLWRSLDIFRHTFDAKDLVLLRPNSRLFKYMQMGTSS